MMFLAAVLAGGMISCKEEEGKTTLTKPVVNLEESTVSSLTFSWDAVENATQYVYSLSDPSSNVVSGDETTSTSATFTGLESNTTYTFTVSAYGDAGKYSASEEATITATTAAVAQLDTPALTVNTEGGVTISWNAVENAASYEYSYCKEGEEDSKTSGSTTETSVTIAGLSSGTYTFEIYAKSGDESHSDSEAATTSFSVERQELWRVTGDFSCGDVTGERELVAYDDGSYSLKSWFGVEGYDLDFTVNSDQTLNITNAYYVDEYGYYYVYSTEVGVYRCLYPAKYGSDYFSYFSGDKSSGSFYCYDYYASDYYVEFSWESNSFIDSLVGTYSQNTTGYTWMEDFSNWQDISSYATSEVTITKTDETTVSIKGIYYEDYSLTATVDESARTLTIAPQTWLEYYTWGSDSDSSASVVATVDDSGVITISNWAAYYGGYSYTYNTSTTLTKK